MIDLANEVIKATHKPKNLLNKMSIRSAFSIRNAMQTARRFVLDESMSELLGHLSSYDGVPNDKTCEVLTAARRSARLPYPEMFVQLDGKAFRRGLDPVGNKKDPWGKPLVPVTDDLIDPIGWLLETGYGNNGFSASVVSCTEYVMLDKMAGTFPFVWVWSPDDMDMQGMPFNFLASENGPATAAHEIDVIAGQVAHGISGCRDNSCGVVYVNKGGFSNTPPYDLVNVKSGDKTHKIHSLVAETGGVMRYIWTFLSTLNEIPVRYERQRPTKSYLANGRIRTAVDHEVIRLTLPNRAISYRQFARNLMKERQRHKDHPVRGHWRTFQAQPGYQCIDETGHIWGPTDATGHADCVKCETSRTWINDHRRGDKTLGTVEHKYQVTGRVQ